MKNFIVTEDKIRAIFDAADPAQEFQKLPVQTAFYAIKSRGLDDAHDLISLASSEQIIRFLDLDCWDKETIDIRNLHQWLDCLMNSSDEKLTEVLKTIDIEILSYIFSQETRIYRHSDSLDIRCLRNFFYTEDNQYVIEVMKKDYFEVIKMIAYKIAEDDRAFALTFFESIAFTLLSTLEENAVRLRKARLEDLGIIDFYDAQDIYSYVRPSSAEASEGKPLFHDTSFIQDISKEQSNLLPEIFWSKNTSVLFLDRALDLIDDVTLLNNIQTQLLYLANKIVSANRINFSSIDSVRERMEELRSNVNLGLEYVSQLDITKAKEILGKQNLSYLFKLGFSLTLDLKRKVESLEKLTHLTSRNAFIDFFGESYGNLLLSLSRKRPVLFIEDSKIRYITTLEEYNRTFATINYLESVVHFLIKYCGFDFTKLNQIDTSSLNIRELREITFIQIINTLLAHRMLSHTTSFEPLDTSNFIAFARMLQISNIRDTIKNEIKILSSNSFSEVFYDNLLKDTFDACVSEVKNVDLTNFDVRFCTTILIMPKT